MQSSQHLSKRQRFSYWIKKGKIQQYVVYKKKKNLKYENIGGFIIKRYTIQTLFKSKLGWLYQ